VLKKSFRSKPGALFDFILFIALEHSSSVTFPSQIDYQNNIDIEKMLELEQMLTLCRTEKDMITQDTVDILIANLCL
jgi:hypothetical protein